LAAASTYEGTPGIEELTEGAVAQLDLSVPHVGQLPRTDWSVTMEVAEHIPAQYEATFLETVLSTARLGVILTWARPGQGGHGHVNEQDEAYVAQRLEAAGFDELDVASQFLRAHASFFWLKSNSRVFVRRGGLKHSVPFHYRRFVRENLLFCKL
jgi:hypothetical protein